MRQNHLAAKIMTKQLQIYCAIVMGAGMWASAPSASAQDEETKRPERPAVERPRLQAARGGGLLGALDKNGDGELDQSEIDMAVASLRKLDRNGDGKITRDEIGPLPPREGSAPPPDQPGTERQVADLLRLDKDGDGKISKEEAPERMQANFDRMDRNGDGFIDKEEQVAVLRFLRQRAQDGAGGAGGQRRLPESGAGEGGTDKPKRPPIDEP